MTSSHEVAPLLYYEVAQKHCEVQLSASHNVF